MQIPSDDERRRAFEAQPNVLVPELLHEQQQEIENIFGYSYEKHLFAAQDIRAALQEQAFYGEGYVPELYRQNDALGYQRRYREARERGAPESELQELAMARRVNIETGFNEAMNALDFDLSVPLIYDIDEDGRISHGGMYVDEMYHRSLTPVNCDAELDRREIEAATNAAWQDVAWQEGITELGRIDISMRNTDPAAIGYVEEIDKLQIRFSKIIDTDEGRKLYTQALMIDGRGMQEAFMNQFLRHIGHVEDDEPQLDRTEILGRPIIAPLTEIDGPIGFVRSMDEYRTLITGESTIVGVSAANRPDLAYDALEAIAEERRARAAEAVEDIDVYAQSLVDDDIPYEDAEMMLEKYQKLWAMDICRNRPDLARRVFNQETYTELMRVRELEDQGYHEAAQEVFENAYENAPNLQGCGATCRLEQVSSVEEKTLAAARGLKVYDASGELWKDHKWQCPGCGSKGGLRGQNGIICLGCGDDRIDGQSKEQREESERVSGMFRGLMDELGMKYGETEVKKKKAWFKSFAEVQAEFEANQERRRLQEAAT